MTMLLVSQLLLNLMDVGLGAANLKTQTNNVGYDYDLRTAERLILKGNYWCSFF
jgi:hypothetical protein